MSKEKIEEGIKEESKSRRYPRAITLVSSRFVRESAIKLVSLGGFYWLHLGIRFRAIESRQGGVGCDLSRFEFEGRDVGNGSAILWRTLEETIDRENILIRSDPIDSRLSFSLKSEFCLPSLFFSYRCFFYHTRFAFLFIFFFFCVNAVMQSPNHIFLYVTARVFHRIFRTNHARSTLAFVYRIPEGKDSGDKLHVK